MSIRAKLVSAVAVAASAFALSADGARAEWQFSIYGGANENFSSTVSLSKAPVTDSRSVDWDGKSFSMPPYWGVRGTYWWNGRWGIAVDYTHAKAYANLDFASDLTYSHLEFTDGNNLLLVNLMYRWNPLSDGPITAYAGLGVGVAVPHVEVRLKAFPAQDTWEYQLAGPAAQILGGLEYALAPNWSVFLEGKLAYSSIHADLKGGGTLETELWSPQLAVGLTYRFDWH